MTEEVISVLPSSSVQNVAKVLLDARISAVPVVDEAGVLLGIVSEGDLLGRSTDDRLAGQEWWLAIMSGPGQMEAAETASASARQVRDVMQTPVVTVGADTPLREVAEILRAKEIKRVPVMRDGRMIGIVSRADLLRAMEAQPVVAHRGGPGTLAAMIGSFFGSPSAVRPAHAAALPSVAQPAPMSSCSRGVGHDEDGARAAPG